VTWRTAHHLVLVVEDTREECNRAGLAGERRLGLADAARVLAWAPACGATASAAVTAPRMTRRFIRQPLSLAGSARDYRATGEAGLVPFGRVRLFLRAVDGARLVLGR
jgi:hypothetical protein